MDVAFPEVMPTRLRPDEWRARRTRHVERVERWTAPHLQRASRGERHPVYDFLFEYYSFRPGQLRRWHPGVGVVIEDPDETFTQPPYQWVDNSATISTDHLGAKRLAAIQWIADWLAAVDQRPPAFGCFGLHEWAMVYRTTEVRHPRWPLRLGAAGTAAVVDSMPIRCSHYDAFRFFTPAARPLNRLQPTRETVQQNEQSGCLHANMDLYKWAYKLAPFTASELIADAFELAWDIREVDMRASPYDLRELSFEPIPIETEEGRRTYEGYQRQFAERARPLRARLLATCRAILEKELCA